MRAWGASGTVLEQRYQFILPQKESVLCTPAALQTKPTQGLGRSLQNLASAVQKN